jgi:capsular polysaccharide transport system ATP-binding protein
MLVVRDLAKSYPTHGRRRWLFQDLNFELSPGGRIALIGRNGQGKSTLIKILGGVLPPTRGSARWSMTCSWPLGFGGFHGGMSGMDAIRLIARIYQKPIKDFAERIDDFADLGEALYMPIKHYSSGMSARLAFGLSLAIDFDCYLIDEVIAVGDAAFTQRCEEELFGRRAHKAFIIATHSLDFLRTHCDRAIVIDNGQAKLFDDVGVAIDVYNAVWEEHHNPDALRI